MIQIPVTEESFLATMAALLAANCHGAAESIMRPRSRYYRTWCLGPGACTEPEQDALSTFWHANPEVQQRYAMEHGFWKPSL